MVDTTIIEIAAAQHWTFTRRQVLAAGGDDGLIRRRVRSGTWATFRPGVHGLAHHPDSWERRLWIVYLAAGIDAVVSHLTAAAMHRMPGCPRGPLELTIPHPQHQRVAGATVHQSRRLPRHHWVILSGRRTTTFARTLVDLAATTTKVRLDECFQHGIVAGHLTLSKMATTFEDLLVPGRRGMLKLGSVLDDRATGPVPAVSVLEARLFEVAGGAGLVPQRQHPLPGHHGVAGCVDGALVDARLILVADGRRWHTRVSDFNRDRARDNQAARAGWDTLRFPWESLVDDPDDAAATIRDVYDQRLALLARI